MNIESFNLLAIFIVQYDDINGIKTIWIKAETKWNGKPKWKNSPTKAMRKAHKENGNIPNFCLNLIGKMDKDSHNCHNTNAFLMVVVIIVCSRCLCCRMLLLLNYFILSFYFFFLSFLLRIPFCHANEHRIMCNKQNSI